MLLSLTPGPASRSSIGLVAVDGVNADKLIYYTCKPTTQIEKGQFHYSEEGRSDRTYISVLEYLLSVILG
jgi:hypothetical protein